MRWQPPSAYFLLLISCFLFLTSYAPALPSLWFGMMLLPRQWVETILHQFSDVGIICFPAMKLQSISKHMYLNLLSEEGFKPWRKKLEPNAARIIFPNAERRHLQLDDAKALAGVCEKKKSRSRCAHFDFGVRFPTPQFQCCYLRTDLAYKNRLFFAPPLHS